ncbi:MAG: hypothetical protein FD167_2739 [bacterium]|nr:MAG: hypothetical protein FD167_2739 [bacterium]
MSKPSTFVLLIAVFFSLSILSPNFTYAQINPQIQLSENAANAAKSIAINTTDINKEANNSSSSLEAMNVQLKAQQIEIDALKEQVQKLEALLITVSKQPAYTNTYPSSSAIANNTVPVNFPAPKIRPAPAESRTSKELLPELGQIGAEVGLLIGGSQNPFKTNEGFFAGGFIDLPLRKMPGGKLSYEIMIGAQRTVSTQQSTSGVIALVNSALNAALGNPPGINNLLSPLPITNKVRERLTILTVVPASFKYTMLSLDKHNVRPYVVVGLGTYVGLSSQKLVDFDASKFVSNPALGSLLNALLNGAQVGGLIPIAPELRSRGVSAGQGDFRFGLNAGGGLEFRVSPKFSFGFDYRINKIEGKNGTFSTFTAKPTVHF